MMPTLGIGKEDQRRMRCGKSGGSCKAGQEWILDADLKDFFGSVDHEKLMALVNQRVADGRVLRIIESILKAGCYAQGKTTSDRSGNAAGRGDITTAEQHPSDSV